MFFIADREANNHVKAGGRCRRWAIVISEAPPVRCRPFEQEKIIRGEGTELMKRKEGGEWKNWVQGGGKWVTEIFTHWKKRNTGGCYSSVFCESVVLLRSRQPICALRPCWPEHDSTTINGIFLIIIVILVS
ncbi:hypothetical protein EVAR_75709_1 [Eumeta japonica]|uniref:Uncharacterized protein n=1 Tax=Eumeta variegata TaxID=151549 RepID=A0A4C1W1X5_EUMVA|nr:hypothetical protein EVAR_75709_1 [Eumeta japonica]